MRQPSCRLLPLLFVRNLTNTNTKQRADLSQIRDNLDDVEPKPYYDSKERMKIDLDLMIKNCKTYNAETTDYWAAADALEGFINEKLSGNFS